MTGGGAAGMMAAWAAAANGHSVTLFEKNEKLGKKIYITGKGRCNYSNNIDISDYFSKIISNPKFLYAALYGFTNADMTAFLNDNGCRTKVERGERMFPASDHASDVTKAVSNALNRAGVEVVLNTKLTDILVENGRVSGVKTSSGSHMADAVILATGGLSYPTTGSTGDGLRFLDKLGISIKETYPALVALVTKEPLGEHLMGLSLKNVELVIGAAKKPIYREFGELLFTDKGISGPIALSASSAVTSAINNGKIIEGYIDLKPALDENKLDERLIREIQKMPNKKLKSLFSALLPGKLAVYFPIVCGIDPEKECNSLTKKERTAIVDNLKHFTVALTGTGSFKEAIITQGGVSVKEIDPSTMELKKIHGLYVAGEMIDVDALTGGFNLQIAFSTGVLAGRSVE